MKNRYFINDKEKKMILMDGGCVRVFNEVFEEVAEIENELVFATVEVPKKKYKMKKFVNKGEKGGRTKTAEIYGLIDAGMEPADIAERIGMSLPGIMYHVRNHKGSTKKKPVKVFADDENESAPEESLEDVKMKMASARKNDDEDLDIEAEEDLVKDIKSMWAEGGRNSLAVCNELGISLTIFNTLIQKYNITKS